MIPFIRSLSELWAITHSRDNNKHIIESKEVNTSIIDSAQRKRYIRSLKKDKVNLPDLPKAKKHRWIHSKEVVSKFIDTLDYNNQIQSSYELTLLAGQTKIDHKEAA